MTDSPSSISLTERLRQSNEEGDRVLREVARAYGRTLDHHQHGTLITEGDTWKGIFWWDTVEERLKVFQQGSMTGFIDASNDAQERMDEEIANMVESAVRAEEQRRRHIAWENALPQKKKGKVKTAAQEDEPTQKGLVFGDLPIGWSKKNRKRKRT